MPQRVHFCSTILELGTQKTYLAWFLGAKFHDNTTNGPSGCFKESQRQEFLRVRLVHNEHALGPRAALSTGKAHRSPMPEAMARPKGPWMKLRAPWFQEESCRHAEKCQLNDEEANKFWLSPELVGEHRLQPAHRRLSAMIQTVKRAETAVQSDIKELQAVVHK